MEQNNTALYMQLGEAFVQQYQSTLVALLECEDRNWWERFVTIDKVIVHTSPISIQLGFKRMEALCYNFRKHHGTHL